MKFTRINDILVLSDYGEKIGDEDIGINFSNPGSGNYLIIASLPETAEVARADISDYISVINKDYIKEDGDYTITLYEKTEDNLKPIAMGRFGIINGVICASPESYLLEIQKVWATLVYIAEKLGVDEEAIDTLITGFVTE